QPVVDRVAYYLEHHERYAYEQLLLLAALAATRQLPVSGIPFLGMVIRNVLDSAADVVAKLIHAGREPMICSEFVYRCYEEANDPIQIGGADVMSIESSSPPTPAAGEVAASAHAFLAAYSLAKRRGAAVAGRSARKASARNGNGRRAAPNGKPTVGVEAVADF